MQNRESSTKIQLLLSVLSYLSRQERYVSRLELESIFMINARSIRRIIAELRESGFEIKAQRGKEGGYKLLRSNLLLPFVLGEEHHEAWKLIKSFLSLNFEFNSHPYTSELIDIINFQIQGQTSDIHVYLRTKISFSALNRITNFHQKIQEAILKKQVLELNYRTRDGKIREGIMFEPYGLIIYEGFYYAVGYLYKTLNLRYFRLNRILDLKRLQHLFIKDKELPKDLKFSKEVFSPIKIKLKIKNNRLDLADYIFGDDQEINYYQNDFIITCIMKGKEAIKELVLSLGENAKLLEPLFLIEEIKQEIKVMNSFY